MQVSIKSTHDGSELIFSDIRRSSKGALLSFSATINSANLKCSINVDGYMSDSLPAYFAELDNLMTNFGGWEGSREWSSLEGEIAIVATADSLGHVTAIITLKSGHYDLDWNTEIGLLLEAGQLSGIVKDVRSAFETSAT